MYCIDVKGNKPIILITGYSSGIGKEFISSPAARRKYRFLLVGKTVPDHLGSNDIFLNWDFQKSKPSGSIDIKSIKLDAIVLHQGILIGKDFRDITEDEICQTININLLSAVRLIKLFFSCLSSGSTLIFYSSISASKGSYDDVYALSKAGLEAFSNSISLKLAPLGVRVICIAPGLVESTRMTNHMKPGLFEDTLKKIPMGRAVSARAIARFSIDLLENKELTLSGNVIHINGGQYIS